MRHLRLRTTTRPTSTRKVNTPGLQVYAKLEHDRRFKPRAVDLHTQSNPLPICLGPALLNQSTMSLITSGGAYNHQGVPNSNKKHQKKNLST